METIARESGTLLLRFYSEAEVSSGERSRIASLTFHTRTGPPRPTIAINFPSREQAQ
jgi:hypothetical protein